MQERSNKNKIVADIFQPTNKFCVKKDSDNSMMATIALGEEGGSYF